MYKIYRRVRQFRPFGERFHKRFILFVKSLFVVAIPFLIMFPTLWLWYHFLFSRGIHMPEKAEAMLTSALIPTLGILYSILTTMVLSTVWTEFKNIRAAIKQGDLETFLYYRNEDVTPLVYILVLVCSLFLLLSFMAVNYSDVTTGLLTIGSMSYLLALFFVVLVEMDDPCSGFWFIRNIDPEWLAIDSREYLAKLRNQRKLERLRGDSGKLPLVRAGEE